MKDGSVAFFSSYDPGLVAALKADIPYMARRWDRTQKCWFVSSQYAVKCAELAALHLNVKVRIPSNLSTTTTSTSRLLKVEYIGAAKDRGGDEPIAYGYANGGWTVMFSLTVLRRWFEPGDDAKPGEAPTLYGVLGLKRDAVPIQIKKAYRRCARQWHPDVCKEPDAAIQFRRIQEAYEVLGAIDKRVRYDAGLKLEASLRRTSGKTATHQWRAPLRCGFLLVEGIELLGRFNVSRIKQWEDILDGQGRMLVTFWPRGGDMFVGKWV